MEGGRRFDYPGMNKVDELLTPILFIRFRNPGLELSTCTEPDWRQTTPQCVSHCPISQPVRFASGASSFQTVEASEIKAISGAVSSCVYASDYRPFSESLQRASACRVSLSWKAREKKGFQCLWTGRVGPALGKVLGSTQTSNRCRMKLRVSISVFGFPYRTLLPALYQLGNEVVFLLDSLAVSSSSFSSFCSTWSWLLSWDRMMRYLLRRTLCSSQLAWYYVFEL